MAAIRSRYWIPRLRQLAKHMIKRCYGCKQFQDVAHAHLPVGNLPKDRTEGSVPFQVIGVDFAGSITYQIKGNKDGKAYIILFTCSLTRVVYLEVLPNQVMEKFNRCLKRLIARRGRPEKIYSNNGKTFVAAARWLCKIMKEEVFNDFWAKYSIRWQFNLSRAPWWGGQFERMVGLVKQVFHKTVGGANLKWDELQDVLLNCEIVLNNRPLRYVEDDAQLPILTPNVMMFGQSNLLPEEPVELITEKDMRKRARYLKRCKDVLWSRWTGEYLRALRESHVMNNNKSEVKLKAGDVVLIKGEKRNRGKWNIGIVEEMIKGRDGVVRVVKIKGWKLTLGGTNSALIPTGI